jgi:hypothetical protein
MAPKRKAKKSIPCPGNKRKGFRGSRATADGREITAIYGQELRISRMKIDGKWVAVSRTREDGKKFVDSRVHRYGQERGFKRKDCDDVLENDARAQLVREEMRNVEHYPKSHKQRVEMFGNFECFVLKAHPKHKYADFFNKIADATHPGPPIAFMPPPDILIESYVLYVRGTELGDNIPGRYNKYNSIRCYLGMISGTLLEFGYGGGLQKTQKTADLLKKYEEEDEVCRAKVLELGEDLPALFRTVFGTDVLQTYSKRVEFWARVLTTIGTIGRTSCTTKHCPKIEDSYLPKDDDDYLDDGCPRFIVIGYRDWKSRNKKCKRKHPVYRVRLYSNPKCNLYCPVHWLLEHWKLCFGHKEMQGPLLKKLSEDQFRKQLSNVFERAGIGDCSGHSLRRTAAQWARRCGADLYVIKNVGRWSSLDNLELYLRDTDEIARDRMRNNGGRDPLLDFWLFDEDSQFDAVHSK